MTRKAQWTGRLTGYTSYDHDDRVTRIWVELANEKGREVMVLVDARDLSWLAPVLAQYAQADSEPKEGAGCS